MIDGVCSGYKPKRECPFEIDHVIPKNIFQIDHPRNYIIIAAALNEGIKDLVDVKLGLLHITTIRAVKSFSKSINAKLGPALKLAIEAVVGGTRLGGM